MTANERGDLTLRLRLKMSGLPSDRIFQRLLGSVECYTVDDRLRKAICNHPIGRILRNDHSQTILNDRRIQELLKLLNKKQRFQRTLCASLSVRTYSD